MSEKTCLSCSKKKALLECGVCHETVCKYCAQIVEDEQFSFLPEIPEKLSYTTYCIPCFDINVAADLEEYNRIMEAAKEIHVFDIGQGKETRLIKRIEDPVSVVDCPDRQEAILRLAFFAAQKNFNSLLDMNLTSRKVREGSRQRAIWSGTAIPAQVDSQKLLKDRAVWDNPN